MQETSNINYCEIPFLTKRTKFSRFSLNKISKRRNIGTYFHGQQLNFSPFSTKRTKTSGTENIQRGLLEHTIVVENLIFNHYKKNDKNQMLRPRKFRFLNTKTNKHFSLGRHERMHLANIIR